MLCRLESLPLWGPERRQYLGVDGVFHTLHRGVVEASILMDTGSWIVGCVSSDHIDSTFTRTQLLEEPISIAMGGATTVVTHVAEIDFQLAAHRSRAHCLVMPLGNLDFDLIIGIPWIKHHQPVINWERELLTFNSRLCHTECLIDPEIGTVPFQPPIGYNRTPSFTVIGSMGSSFEIEPLNLLADFSFLLQKPPFRL